MKSRSWLSLGAFFLSIGCINAANILTNAGFEANVISPATFLTLGSGNTSALPGWTVTGATCGSNCILVLDNTYAEGPLHFFAHGGGQSLDLTGGGNTINGGVQQTVNLAAGNYQLSFWLGNMDNTAANYGLTSAIQVFINGGSQGTFSNNNNTSNQTNWQQAAFGFTSAGGSTTIEFRNATGAADALAGLDDVFLDAAAVGVPEPSTLGLAALGLAAVGIRLRRQSR